MKSILKVASTVCIILGSVIGAGFATGKEVYNFFYGTSPLSAALLSFLFFTAVTCLILFSAKKTSSATIKQLLFGLLGKASSVIEIFIIFCYFLVMSTMLAAANTCVSELLGVSSKLPFFAVITALLSGFALLHELKGIKIVNLACVPLIILFIIVICSKPAATFQETAPAFASGLSYACFNCLMMIGILLSQAESLSKKECFFSALISSAVISLLIFVIMRKLNDEIFALTPMPLISIAKSYGSTVSVISAIVFYLSVFTSIISDAYPIITKLTVLTRNKKTATVSVMFFSTLFSTIGFSLIVDKIYPIMALLGVVIFGMLFLSLLFTKINSLFSKRSEKKTLKTKI